MTLWLATAFGAYLLTFEIKYLPGNLYVNVVMSTSADIAAKVYAYAQYERLGLQRSFFVGLGLSLVGCLMILMSEGVES